MGKTNSCSDCWATRMVSLLKVAVLIHPSRAYFPKMHTSALVLAASFFASQLIAAQDTREDSHSGGDRSVALVETPPGEQAAPVNKEETQSNDAKNSEKKGEWMLAPIPVSSPAIGSGFEWAVARLFPFNKRDEVSPVSSVGVAGIFTNNGSRGIAVGGRLYMKEDHYRVAAGIASASVNFDVYGIGEASGPCWHGIFANLRHFIISTALELAALKNSKRLDCHAPFGQSLRRPTYCRQVRKLYFANNRHSSECQLCVHS